MRPDHLTVVWRGRADGLPLALADAHWESSVGARLELRVRATRVLTDARVAALVEGAGFFEAELARDDGGFVVRAVRARTLPDVVGPGMRLLCVGLNPSLCSADRGVGFARPGNRFWPAARAAGIVAADLDRDTRRALFDHAVGFTDLVKRATVGAAELAPSEYTAGASRVGALVAWLRPQVVCFLGVTGYRDAIDRHAQLGWQPDGFAGAGAYVMPNPSGLNAHAQIPDLAAHLRAAYAGAR
jgi:TDG/mug DNA glycosylase family protein